MEVDDRPRHGWRALLLSIRDYARGGIAKTLAIVTAASIMEGLGLILLLPIADLVFSGNDSGGAASAYLSGAFGTLGVAGALPQLALLCGLFLLLMLLRAGILLRRDAMLTELSQGYVDQLRKRLFTALARADWPVIKRMQRAHLLDNMTTNIARVSGAMRFLTQALVTLLMVAAYLVSGFVINWMIGAVLLVISALALAAALYWSKRSEKLGNVMTQRNRAIMDETTRFLDGLKTAKACQAADVFAERFSGSIDDARQVSVRFVRQQGKMRRMVELLGAIAAVMLLLGGYGLLALSGAELLVMGAVVIRLMPSLIALLSGLQTIAYALPAFTAAEEIRTHLEAEQTGEAGGKGGDVDMRPAPVTLRDVCINMPGDDGEVTILRVGKLDLPATGLIHVSGPSGAGKSTLAELLAGLHLPSSGSVETAGITLEAASRAAWQSRIAFAPQEAFLFGGSVRENLCWPNVDADDEAIWAALEIAAARDLVRGLPGGLDHPLLDGGSRLSGGERQRLCLARAILRPSSLLIVDEATSAVDAELEGEIMVNLHRLAKTKAIICISHSGSARKLADRSITVSGDGRVS